MYSSSLVFLNTFREEFKSACQLILSSEHSILNNPSSSYDNSALCSIPGLVKADRTSLTTPYRSTHSPLYRTCRYRAFIIQRIEIKVLKPGWVSVGENFEFKRILENKFSRASWEISFVLSVWWMQLDCVIRATSINTQREISWSSTVRWFINTGSTHHTTGYNVVQLQKGKDS